MIAAVLDANVLASGFLGFTLETSTPGELLRRWADDDFQMVVSHEILTELEDHACASDYFQQRLPMSLQHYILTSLRQRCQIVSLTSGIQGVASDPDDDHVLDAAVSAGVAYLVTGDRALQALGSFRGVQIVDARTFLSVLNQDQMS